MFESEMKEIFKRNIGIWIILAIAALERFLIAKQLGITYALGSDDLAYIESAITFAQTGQITMHGVISAQIMPGMPLLLVPLVLIFGKGKMLWMAMKGLWTLMGLASIFGVYRIGLLFNKTAALVAAALMLTVDFAWMDNLILTETPYMFFFVYLIYFSLRLANESAMQAGRRQNTANFPDRRWGLFAGILICYIGALMIRPTIALYPVILLLYLLFRRYDPKTMAKQLAVAALALAIILTPWTIRNFKQFDHFVPLTYGMGNPLLLGTYQGEGFPKDEEIDYKKEVKEKLPEDMEMYALDKKGISPYMLRYYSLRYDEYKAKYRMKLWWAENPKSMLKSYLWIKPNIIMRRSFLWEETLGVTRGQMDFFRKAEWAVSGIALMVVLLFGGRDKKRYQSPQIAKCSFRTDTIFLFTVYLSQVALYSYSFAFERYGQTILFMRFIVIGIAISLVMAVFLRYNKLK